MALHIYLFALDFFENLPETFGAPALTLTFSLTICSVQTDTIGKEALERKSYTYNYNNESIPPLAMVDDVLTISKCGIDSVMTNAYVNSKFEMMKLKLNESKCKQIHIGKNEKYCPTLHTSESEMIKDVFDKYLGDIISKNGNNKHYY